jgi:hypothetical protein
MPSYSPRQRTILRRAGNDREEEDISAHVMVVETHKAYRSPQGKFNITLPFAAKLKSYRYDEMVKPNDVVEVYINVDDEWVPVMIGLVDEVARVKQLSPDGKPNRTVQLRCSDFGKILCKHHCQWYLAPSSTKIGSQENLTGAVYAAMLIAGGDPTTIATMIVERELFKYMPWLRDYITTDRIRTDDSWYINPIILSTQESVWQALEQASNDPYNQLHCDTQDDGMFAVILERTPFDNNGKLDIQSPRSLHVINEKDVITEDMGVNDIDRITYLYNKVNCGIHGEPGGSPLLYIYGDATRFENADIEKYGFMPWMPATAFVPFPRGSTPIPSHLADFKEDANRPVRSRTDLLWSWFRRNAEYESGLMTMHGNPRIRCGDGIFYTDNNYQYFVEQVAQKLVCGENPACTTSIHLTRGQIN